jgi:uncharacterized protein (DUF2164 family)
MGMLRKWDIKDEQVHKSCIDELIARIDEQGSSPFGVLAAQEIIDIVSRYVGPIAYNTALEDAKKCLQAKVADLEVELDILKTSI